MQLSSGPSRTGTMSGEDNGTGPAPVRGNNRDFSYRQVFTSQRHDEAHTSSPCLYKEITAAVHVHNLVGDSQGISRKSLRTVHQQRGE